ncbi:MAG: alpha-L-fucosidase [Candidatus Omnitrophica bacterium]|nr:alpha-L-fucosidase [Candidatus Omnitrophota bacterium]
MLKPEKTPGKTDWFVNDRFGLFIHWGIYAVPARHEWIKNYEKITTEDYQKYFDHFNPDLYDPKIWAKAAKDAGMKYAVITTKHHDGFCLWDSKLTDYKATNTPAPRDLLKEYVEAFRKEGLKIGFYHSLIDWHHPEFPVDFLHPQKDDEEFKKKEAERDIKKYAEYLHGQVKELLTEFGKIDILWFDFSYNRKQDGMKGKGKDDWESEKLLKMIRELMPDIIINNRLEIDQDIHTPEQFQPRGWVHADNKPVVWEACQTLNGSWGYDRDNLDWKSTDMLVKMLIDGVSKGGNLLLNVGPTARGEFDPLALARLSEIGEWMRLHGRSIYGATQSEFTAPQDCRFTQKGKRLYLHIFSWPLKAIHLDDMADKIKFAQLLNDGSEIKMQKQNSQQEHTALSEAVDSNTLTLILPIQKPNVEVPVIELFLE